MGELKCEIKAEIWRWVRRHILRKKERLEVRAPVVVAPPVRRVRNPRLVIRPRKAVHQDMSRFMAGKGKGQHRWYRRSIKSKKGMEDEE